MSEWQPVLKLDGRGYWPGLDRSKRYQFRRLGETGVEHFILAEQSPYFNVAGLLWRDPLASLNPQNTA